MGARPAGTTFYFKVRAINAGGVGAASSEVSTRAATVASAPRTLAAPVGRGSAGLTWVAPASNGGSPVTGYNVFEATVAGGESAIPVNAAPLAATAVSCTVTGLSNATKYYFTVRAVNAVASSTPSNESSATPLTVTVAPTHVLAFPGKASAGVTWLAPDVNGGSPITGYNVYKGTVSGGESATPVNAAPLSPATGGYVVSGLINAKEYDFTVKAVTAAGVGASNHASTTPAAGTCPPGLADNARRPSCRGNGQVDLGGPDVQRR